MTSNSTGAWTIVDTDAHVTEPADVWTARVPKKYAEIVPHVAGNPNTVNRHWRVGDVWYWPVAGAQTSQVGWKEFLPSGPVEYEEADPAVYSAEDRLQRMDEYGVAVQIIYPNLIGFVSASLIPLGLEVSTMAVRAWNDFMVDWCSADPKRLVPMAMLPFWDIESSVREMERCVNLGFKGVLFANKFERLGLPSFVAPHWDPIYRAAQDFDIPVNFHVGFGWLEEIMAQEADPNGVGFVRKTASREEMQKTARGPALAVMENDDCLGQILTSGLCEKFPRLKLVNVETGFGHIPFYLEALDWHWRAYGNASSLPHLPSDYFRRQCYGTYWFEYGTLSGLSLYPDNFMFSTDFPHGTSLAPGPCAGTSLTPSAYVAQSHSELDPVVRDKALSGNAAEVYKLELPARVGESAGV